MRLDPNEVSTNIEDRRGETWEQSQQRQQSQQPLPTLPPLVHRPGDLPSQAGLDDIDAAAASAPRSW